MDTFETFSKNRHIKQQITFNLVVLDKFEIWSTTFSPTWASRIRLRIERVHGFFVPGCCVRSLSYQRTARVLLKFMVEPSWNMQNSWVIFGIPSDDVPLPQVRQIFVISTLPLGSSTCDTVVLFFSLTDCYSFQESLSACKNGSNMIKLYQHMTQITNQQGCPARNRVLIEKSRIFLSSCSPLALPPKQDTMDTRLSVYSAGGFCCWTTGGFLTYCR